MGGTNYTLCILSWNIIIINTDTEQNILQRKGKGLCCWSGDGVCREWRWSFAGGPESRQQHKPIYSDVCKYLSQWQIYIWVASFTRFCNFKMSKGNIRIVSLDHHALSCSILHMKDTVKSYKCQTLHNFNHFGLSPPSLKASHLRMLRFSASSPFQRFILHYLPRPDGD